jgi:hypothetical protein
MIIVIIIVKIVLPSPSYYHNNHRHNIFTIIIPSASSIQSPLPPSPASSPSPPHLSGDMITQRQTATKTKQTDESNESKNDILDNFDVRRNLAFGAFGAIWSAPGLLFYRTLDRKLPIPTKTLQGAIAGALIGELIMDLPLSVPAFLIITDLVRGRDTTFITDHLVNDWPDCAATSFCLWFHARTPTHIYTQKHLHAYPRT